MEQITIETLRSYSKKELRDYYSYLLKNVKEDGNGNVVNVEIYNDFPNNKGWGKATTPRFSLESYFYRLIPESKERFMTDIECRKFIIDNSEKIIVKYGNSLNPYQEVINESNITKMHTYCFKEDFNCENPDLTKWDEFKTMDKL